MYLKDKTYKEQRVIERRKKEALLSLYDKDSDNVMGILRGENFEIDQNNIDNAFVDIKFKGFIVGEYDLSMCDEENWPDSVVIPEGAPVQISGIINKIVKIRKN